MKRKPILKSDGTPDRRFKINRGLKSDGTPDRRFKPRTQKKKPLQRPQPKAKPQPKKKRKKEPKVKPFQFESFYHSAEIDLSSMYKGGFKNIFAEWYGQRTKIELFAAKRLVMAINIEFESLAKQLQQEVGHSVSPVMMYWIYYTPDDDTQTLILEKTVINPKWIKERLDLGSFFYDLE